jgi:hypothetical protein
MKKIILFLVFSLVTINIYAQTTCITATAFCGSDPTSTSLMFPNSTGGSGGPIACLNSTPNPHWFYFKVDQSGTLIFDIIQNTAFDGNGLPTGTALDVDFAVWGPFASASANCGNINNTGCPAGCPNNTTNPGAYPRPLPSNLVDCSYDASPTEHMTINGAAPGQYYLAMITNFSGQPGFIKLEQRAPILSTHGSTDCDLVCGISLGPDRTECAGTPINITTTFASTPTSGTPPFQWFFNGVLQPAYNNMQTITVNQAGTWSVKTTRPGGCYEVTDSMLLTYISIPVTQPSDIVLCTSSSAPYVFSSINKDTQILGALPASDYTITYHTTQIDAENGVASIPFANLTNYSISSSSVRIFVRIEDNNTGCVITKSFNLIVTAAPAGTFSYSGNPYSSDMATAQAIMPNGLTSGGVFTSTPAGLSINTTTGEIIPSMSTPGTYTVNYDIAASASCPAFNTTTTVTVDTMPVADVTQNLGTLSAVQSGSTYKWYKCPNTLLPGETNQSYTPTVAGDYKVVITLGNYTVTSACVMVTTLSTSEFQLHSKFRLYPNPNKGILNIDSEVNGEILIVNQLGQVVKKVIVKANTANSINIHELMEGTYFVKGTNKMNIGTQKLIIKK